MRRSLRARQLHVDLRADPAHCGSCAIACSYRNAVPLCVASACRFGSCLTGFLDCNVSAADGCECDASTSQCVAAACKLRVGQTCTNNNQCATNRCKNGKCSL